MYFIGKVFEQSLNSREMSEGKTLLQVLESFDEEGNELREREKI